MNEKEILEYRQKSAERLGLKYRHPSTLSGKQLPNFPKGYYDENGNRWKPDEDANQMLMIENWLIEQGCTLKLDYTYVSIENKFMWWVDICLSRNGKYNRKFARNDSKSIAFAKAFLEYDKQQ